MFPATIFIVLTPIWVGLYGLAPLVFGHRSSVTDTIQWVSVALLLSMLVFGIFIAALRGGVSVDDRFVYVYNPLRWRRIALKECVGVRLGRAGRAGALIAVVEVRSAGGMVRGIKLHGVSVIGFERVSNLISPKLFREWERSHS